MAIDPQEFGQIMADTEPGKLDDLSPADLQRYYHYLCGHVPHVRDFGQVRHDQCLRRIEELRDAMQASRHQQTHGVGSKTLCWTKVAAVAAIVGVIVTVLLGILQIWLSNTGPSKAGRASPQSFQQTTATISASPEQAATASSTTPSPRPMATEQPSPPPQ